MTLADTSLHARSNAQSTSISATTTRDPRLDFFRGIAMFIILIAHVPSNWLTLWIPARFGFSDATETFVFCSGMASAIAFGRVFRERGVFMGTARVGFRVWQVYWAHIALFFAIAATMAWLNTVLPDGRNYVSQLNLHPFFNRTQENLMGLLTLTYVPNYFDILPMYLVILAMMPIFIALAQVNFALAAAASVGLWFAVQLFGWSLPAEPWSERSWFFNPFAWQLVFFTGFAWMSGWLPAPPRSRALFALAVTIILITLPFAYFRLYNTFPVFLEWRRDWSFLINKSNFGILRYVHFLATAYVAWMLVGPRGERLLTKGMSTTLSRIWNVVLSVIMKVGQQSLAVFIASMFFARILGVIFDIIGRTWMNMALVNAFGFTVIIGVAYGAAWFKSQPWKTKRSEK
ncbi:OpgC domain-containing protein [Planktotalea sp.]|uniref:OpgC family protein n=1 Tax=Planktotalea sp. TaxID=2029877 RepID=UPI003297B6B8